MESMIEAQQKKVTILIDTLTSRSVNKIIEEQHTSLNILNKDISEGIQNVPLYKMLHRSLVALEDKLSIEILLVQVPPNGKEMYHGAVYNEKIKNRR